MNKILFTFYFIIITLNLFSQLNVIVEDSTNNHLYTQMIINNNNDFFLINGSTNIQGNRGISIIKSDSIGNIIEEKFYSKDNEIWYEGKKYNFNQENLTLSGSIITNKRRGRIIFFNSILDTIFSRTLFYDTLVTTFYSNFSTYDNNIVVGGQLVTNNNNVNGLIAKYNNQGDTIWVKDYDNGSDDMLGSKIIETYDSSLISIGFTAIGTAIYKQDWYIVKTDSLGNLDWWLHPGNPQLNDGSAMDIIETKDSCFVVVGGKAVYRNAGGTKFDGRIMKFDINGNILWDKTYRKRLTQSGYDSLYCFFTSIVELDDGGFAVTANEQIMMGGHKNSVLYRFNIDGDTLWTEHYCTRNVYTDIEIPDQEYPTTIQKVENGGFLIGGWGYFGYTFNHPYEQQMFLIKTDSMGCDGTEFTCPMASVPSIVREEEIDLVVYPNPVKECLTLALSKGDGIKAVQNVFIYDVYGRLVKQETAVIASESEAISINVSNLQKGIYFIKVGESVAKFVKE